jgi:hypothetical protein
VKSLLLPLLLPLLLLASCASDSGPDKSSAPARKGLSERMNESNGYKQDSEGNWTPQSDRRSPYESQGETHDAKKDFKKQAYKTGDYTKKSWWGNKDYGRQTYEGNTDGSRFQKSSALQGKGAREGGTNADIPDNYQTNAYATGAAREAGGKQIKKGSNAEIENRRRGYEQPEIIDWREQRTLSMDQSKGILGR